MLVILSRSQQLAMAVDCARRSAIYCSICCGFGVILCVIAVIIMYSAVPDCNFSCDEDTPGAEIEHEGVFRCGGAFSSLENISGTACYS